MPNMDDSALLRAMMEAAVDAIVISDASGTILRANAAASDLFGRNHDDMVGQDVGILMPGAIARLREAFGDTRMGGAKNSIIGTAREVDGERADGSTVPLLISVGRAEADDGPIFVSIMHDLTQRRSMEVAAERSQRMDAIGRMTGGIAHDFNNLLTVVIGNLELLGNADLSERHRTMLRDALSAAELGADVTSRLTAFARNSDLKPRPTDLGEEVEQSLGLLRHTIGSHCEIKAELDPALWPVSLDPSKFQTAILNLAMNSQDAMPDGGALTLDAQNAEIDDSYVAQELGVEPGRYVRVSVSDTGHGMPQQDRDRALEPFFTTKPAGEGTGLGLSIVYGFVKQSGGHLTIYSEPGEGTIVSLYFPVIEGRDVEHRVPRTELHGTANVGTNRTVLIVEDDERLRRLTVLRLTELGFTCVSAETADAAWTLLETEGDVSVVFADMVMPGAMSGYDLARRIAAERPQVAVLLTSGFSESVLQDRYIGNEFRMLRKPYRQEELEAAILALLDTR